MDKNKFLIDLSESTRCQVGKVDFEDQPKLQKVFSAIWRLESQVNNGGFEQYFCSPAGETANFAPTALRCVRAYKCAEIVERANRTLSSDPLPNDVSARESLFDLLTADQLAELERLDSVFFEYPDDLTELLFAFVADHPEVFGHIDEQSGA